MTDGFYTWVRVRMMSMKSSAGGTAAIFLKLYTTIFAAAPQFTLISSWQISLRKQETYVNMKISNFNTAPPAPERFYLSDGHCRQL